MSSSHHTPQRIGPQAARPARAPSSSSIKVLPWLTDDLRPMISRGCRWQDCPREYVPPRLSTIGSTPSRPGFSATLLGRWRTVAGLRSARPWAPTSGAPLSPGRRRRAKTQAVGVLRGGQTTKVHVVPDVNGRPAVLHLTASPLTGGVEGASKARDTASRAALKKL